MQRLAGFMRTYWTRGEPGRPTPRSLAVFMQRMWLAALFFKLLGSSWDVAWHFRWLRDDLAPPHILNTVGTGTAIGLVIAHTFTGYGVEKRSLRIMQWGTGIFVLAGPIDVVNHRVNGLDLTAWSPSHLLLYGGTSIMIAGVIRNWCRTYPRDGGLAHPSGQQGRRPRWMVQWTVQWTAGLIALWALLFEDVYFATGQQEYGILEVASWLRGRPYAEPSLLNFAANQLGRQVDDTALQHFAMPIAPWVYPVWVIGFCVALLATARMMVGFRFTASAVVAGYVGYRCLIWPILTLGNFPASYLPVWLLPLGFAVDGLFLLRLPHYLRAAVGALVLTAVGYGSLWLSMTMTGTPVDLAKMTVAQVRAAFTAGANLLTPPVAWWSIWIAGPLLALTWAGSVWFIDRFLGLDSPRPPQISVEFGPEPLHDARGHLDGWPLPGQLEPGHDHPGGDHPGGERPLHPSTPAARRHR